MHKASGSPVPRRPGRQRHGIAKAGSRFPASGSAGASTGRGKEAAAPGMLLTPGSPEACGTRCPEQGRWVRSGEPAAVPSAREGRRERTRPRKHPGKDEGGAGKLAASSRPRLRSPLLSCPKSSRLQKIFVCTISWYWS